MNFTTTSKQLTKFVAFMYLLALCTYSSMLIGVLAHELTHKHYAIETKAIEVNYNGEGTHYGPTTEPESMHKWVYLQGNIVQVVLNLLTITSLIVLVKK